MLLRPGFIGNYFSGYLAKILWERNDLNGVSCTFNVYWVVDVTNSGKKKTITFYLKVLQMILNSLGIRNLKCCDKVKIVE